MNQCPCVFSIYSSFGSVKLHQTLRFDGRGKLGYQLPSRNSMRKGVVRNKHITTVLTVGTIILYIFLWSLQGRCFRWQRKLITQPHCKRIGSNTMNGTQLGCYIVSQSTREFSKFNLYFFEIVQLTCLTWFAGGKRLSYIFIFNRIDHRCKHPSCGNSFVQWSPLARLTEGKFSIALHCTYYSRYILRSHYK